MWLAHYFPGLRMRVDDVNRLTPEQTTVIHRAGRAVLEHEEKMRQTHTKAIMRSRAF